MNAIPSRHVQVEMAGLGHPEGRGKRKERGDAGELRHTPTEQQVSCLGAACSVASRAHAWPLYVGHYMVAVPQTRL